MCVKSCFKAEVVLVNAHCHSLPVAVFVRVTSSLWRMQVTITEILLISTKVMLEVL